MFLRLINSPATMGLKFAVVIGASIFCLTASGRTESVNPERFTVATAEPNGDIFDQIEKEEAGLGKPAKGETAKASVYKEAIPYYVALAIASSGLAGLVWFNRGKITGSKLKATYLAWGFFHLLLLILAPRPLGEVGEDARNYGSFYPFISKDDYDGELSGLFLGHVEQYDFTEFLFYTLAPGMIWLFWRTWNSEDPGTIKA